MFAGDPIALGDEFKGASLMPNVLTLRGGGAESRSPEPVENKPFTLHTT